MLAKTAERSYLFLARYRVKGRGCYSIWYCLWLHTSLVRLIILFPRITVIVRTERWNGTLSWPEQWKELTTFLLFRALIQAISTVSRMLIWQTLPL